VRELCERIEEEKRKDEPFAMNDYEIFLVVNVVAVRSGEFRAVEE